MASLPNIPLVDPAPPRRKKRAEAATPISRTSDEIETDFRGPTGTGWSPIPRSFDLYRIRLASGEAFWGLTTLIIHTALRDRKPSESSSLEATIKISEAALLCECNERTINRELDYLVERRMAVVVRNSSGGQVRIRLVVEPEGDAFPGWAALERYSAWASSRRASLDERDAEQTTDNPSEDDASGAAVKPGTVQVTKKPRKVKAGKPEKPVPVNCGVRSYRMELVESDSLDVSYTAAVHSGEFVATVCVPKQKAPKSKLRAKPLNSTTSGQRVGHTCPTNAKSAPIRGDGAGGIHPRAKELSVLFDTILVKYRANILSADHAALKAACDQVGDIPYKDLAVFVHQRARRGGWHPTMCAAVVKEAVANWKAKGSPTEAPKRPPARPTPREIEEGILSDLLLLAAMPDRADAVETRRGLEALKKQHPALYAKAEARAKR